MGFIGSFLGKVAGEAVLQGADRVKQKMSDVKAEKEAFAREALKMTKYQKKVRFKTGVFSRREEKEMGLPSDYHDGYCWRVEDYDGYNLTLIKIKGYDKNTTITVTEDKVDIAGES